MGKWFDRLKVDPTDWLLEKSCASIKYRLLTEVAGRPASDPDVTEAREQIYKYKPPLTIANAQSADGIWFNSLIGFEAMNLNRKRGPGVTSQVLALLEYGWDKEDPRIWQTSEKVLQAMLWEDPNFDLCELNGYLGGAPEVEAFLRKTLGRVALAILSRAGFTSDIGVTRKTQEYLETLEAFYGGDGDLHGKLFCGEMTRPKETDEGPVEETCAILTHEAPLPDYFMFLSFAFNPTLRDDEKGRATLSRIVDYMFSRPPEPVEVVEVGGKVFDRHADFMIRSLDRADYESQKLVGRLLQDLELLARCGQLERVPKAVALLEWLIDITDGDGIVRAEDYIEKVGKNRSDYHYFPLEDNWRGKHKKFTDVTFRLLLILRILDQHAAG